MPGQVTVRSPLGIVGALSWAALLAATIAVLWIYVYSRAVGADWILVYGLPALALGCVLVPLRQRFTVSTEGLVVRNAVFGERINWENVEAVTVEPLSISTFLTSFSATGIVVWKKNGGISEAYATCGLRAQRRHDLVEALEAAARAYGFRCSVAADALGRGRTESQEEPSWLSPVRHPGDVVWSGDVQAEPDEVVCVLCGLHASPLEMESFGEEGDVLAWYCADDAACTARRQKANTTPDVE